jgi:hypothetical protein
MIRHVRFDAFRGDALAKLLAVELMTEMLREPSGYTPHQKVCAYTDVVCSNENMTRAAVRAGIIQSGEEMGDIWADVRQKNSSFKKTWHYNGTLYEARLWEIYERDGLEAARGFFAATAMRAFQESYPKQHAA